MLEFVDSNLSPKYALLKYYTMVIEDSDIVAQRNNQYS